METAITSEQERERTINKVLKNPNLCPALFIGKFVDDFFANYTDRIFEIFKVDELRDFINRYSGYSDLEGRYFVLYLGSPSDKIQNGLLKFVEDSKIPIILLFDEDRILPSLYSRMKMVYKVTRAEATAITEFTPIHKAYSRLYGKGIINNKRETLKFASMNCPAISVLENTNPKGDHIIRDLDILISKLSDGKTYTEIINDTEGIHTMINTMDTEKVVIADEYSNTAR